jgi:hypothetical protein
LAACLIRADPGRDRLHGQIKKIHNGRYGLGSVTTTPKIIAGGSGSVTDFNLAINKKGVILGKCPTAFLIWPGAWLCEAMQGIPCYRGDRI